MLRGFWSLRCELLSEATITGFPCVESWCNFLPTWRQEVVDVGTCEKEEIDYPDIAALVARKVGAGRSIAAF